MCPAPRDRFEEKVIESGCAQQISSMIDRFYSKCVVPIGELRNNLINDHHTIFSRTLE